VFIYFHLAYFVVYVLSCCSSAIFIPRNCIADGLHTVLIVFLCAFMQECIGSVNKETRKCTEVHHFEEIDFKFALVLILYR